MTRRNLLSGLAAGLAALWGGKKPKPLRVRLPASEAIAVVPPHRLMKMSKVPDDLQNLQAIKESVNKAKAEIVARIKDQWRALA